MDQLLHSTREQPEQIEFLDETIEAIQTAIHALSHPDGRRWPTLLRLLAFSRRLGTLQSIEAQTPTERSIELMRVTEENDQLRQDLKQLVGKLTARSVARGLRSSQAVPNDPTKAAAYYEIGPFDPEMEPWLASMIARSVPDCPP